ncbi:type II toxin-antitoxin system VapB family antitoxin [Rhizobium gallicum]|nr:type II toxin-antitoxin system VapB family antitoxin [Rhizobium gallicum]
MSLNIKNPATVALVDELARCQGISKTAPFIRPRASAYIAWDTVT